MAAEMTKGVVIDISGNTVKLTKAIRDARQEFVELGSEAKALERAMESGFYSSSDKVTILTDKLEAAQKAYYDLGQTYDQNLEYIDRLDPRMVKIAESIAKMGDEIDKTKRQLANANYEYENNARSLEAIDRAFKEVESSAKLVDSALKSGVFSKSDAAEVLKKEIKEGSKAIDEMSDRYKYLLKNGLEPSDSEMVKLASSIGKMREKVDDATDSFKKLENGTYLTREEQEKLERQQEEAASALTSVTNRVDAWTIALGNLIARGIERAIQALRRFSSAIYDTGTAFEYSMASLEALYGDALNPGDIDQLSGYFRELGTQSAYSATEIADAATALALAGYSLDETESAIAPILQLTQATGESFEDMANIVVDGLHEFGMEATDATRFADVLAKTAISTNTDVQDMGEALKYAGAVAGSFGFEIEDLATALGAMATQGVKGSMAGTALRTTITRLATNVSDARTAFEGIGGSFYDAEGNARSFYDIVKDLRKGMEGLNDEQRSTLLYTIGGQRAITGLSAILNMAEEDFDALHDAVSDANGVVEQISDQKLDNLYGDAKILTNNFEEFKMQLYDGIQPALRDVTQSLTGLLQNKKFQRNIKKLADTVRDGIEWFLDHAPDIIDTASNLATLVIGTFAGVKVAKAIKHVVDMAKAFSTWRTVTKILNPELYAMTTNLMMFAPVVATVAGVIAACALSVGDAERSFRKFDPVLYDQRDAQEELANSIKDTTDRTKEAIEETWGEHQATQSLLNELDKYVDANGNVKESYAERVNFILGELSNATGVEYELIDGQIQHYKELKQTIKEAIDEQARQAFMTAFAEQYADSIKQEAEAQQQFNDALIKQNDYWKNMADTYAGGGYSELLESAGISEETYLKMSDQRRMEFLKGHQEFQTALSREYEQGVTDSWNNLQTAQQNYYEALNALDALSEGNLGDLASKLAESTSTVDKSMVDSIAILQSYVDAYNKLRSESVAQTVAGNSEMAADTQQKANDILATARQLALDMSSPENQVSIEFNKDTGDLEAVMSELKDTAIAGATEAGQAGGEAWTGGIGTGMATGTVPLLQGWQFTLDDIKLATDTSIGKDPANDVGTNYTEGIASGVRGSISNAVNASTSMATQTDNAATNIVSYDKGNSIGLNYVQGLINGIRSRTADAVQAATEFATAVNTALQNTAQVNSPSRFTEWIAEEQVNGLIRGYDSGATKLTNAIDQLGVSNADGNRQTTQLLESIDKSLKNGGNVYIDGKILTGYVNRGLGSI